MSFIAGAAMPVGAILSFLYLKRPSQAVAGMLVAAHALARQIVQIRSLEGWAKLDKMPVRGDWDSFLLFIVVALIVLVCLGWLGRVTIRAARSEVEDESIGANSLLAQEA